MALVLAMLVFYGVSTVSYDVSSSTTIVLWWSIRACIYIRASMRECVYVYRHRSDSIVVAVIA